MHTKGDHATICFLEGFVEGSLKEGLPRRVLRSCLGRAFLKQIRVPEVFLEGVGPIEGA